MKLILLLAVLEGIMAVEYNIVCPPDLCSRLECDPSIQSRCVWPNQEYRPNTGFCGCCGVCFNLLDENTPCFPYSFIPNQPIVSICREPLQCVGNKCSKMSPPYLNE